MNSEQTLNQALNQQIFNVAVDHIRNYPNDGKTYKGYRNFGFGGNNCLCAKGRVIAEGLISYIQAVSIVKGKHGYVSNCIVAKGEGGIGIDSGSPRELLDHLECIYESWNTTKYTNKNNVEEGLQLLAEDYGLKYMAPDEKEEDRTKNRTLDKTLLKDLVLETIE